jgi:hypothetical protein
MVSEKEWAFFLTPSSRLGEVDDVRNEHIIVLVKLVVLNRDKR